MDVVANPDFELRGRGGVLLILLACLPSAISCFSF